MKIVRLGYLPIKKSLASNIYAVISLKGISPTIVCAGGGGHIPYTLEVRRLNEDCYEQKL